ncbi:MULTISPECIES: phosphotransferase [unclassified Bradyrhizobium]|uniref:phosphotransferase n=1 Tax=unclassified Bradyrhizobium TaxID=2631580 RepID=UPI002916C3AB|nr:MULTISPECIES: phosphotransferase [unclassified Bradyrhizobium]
MQPAETAMPIRLAERMSTWLPVPIVRVEHQPSGLAPGIRCTLTLADGSRRFLKAVGDHHNPRSPVIFAREARINVLLPRMSLRPELAAHLSDGRWELLLFEHVAGSAWTLGADEPSFERCVASMLRWVDDPLPAPAGLEPLADVETDLFRGWATLRDAGWPAGSLRSARRLDTLCQLEDEARAMLAGDTLLHGDLRIDNMLISEKAVSIVDWAWASRGSPLFDMLTFLNDGMVRASALCPRKVADDLVAARFPDPAILRGLAALAGFYSHAASRPPVPGLPGLRPFQQRQAAGFLRWLEDRAP